MSKVYADLIYDVGLFYGEDTAYYLFRGSSAESSHEVNEQPRSY